MDITSYLLGKNAGGGGSSDLDWSAIGYSKEPQSITDGYNHAKQIYDNWDNTITNMSSKYLFDLDLYYMPLVDTSNVTVATYAFRGCARLQVIPTLNLSNVTTMSNMFSQCNALSTESLNNILIMCINATSYTGTKKLTELGFSSTYYSASRIQALPKYQDFIDAGWTIGY